MWFQDMLEHDLKFILRSKVYDLDQALLSSAIGTCGQILTLNTSGYLFVIFRSCGSDMEYMFSFISVYCDLGQTR